MKNGYGTRQVRGRWYVSTGGDLSKKEAQAECATLNAVAEPAVAALEPEHLTMTDGYVGSMGKTWETPTAETLELAIAGAMKTNDMTREQVINALASGQALKWGQSPNYYYDHSDALIGRKRSAPPVKLVKCQCGHSVAQALVMSASMGTSCPDCYDRMS